MKKLNVPSYRSAMVLLLLSFQCCVSELRAQIITTIAGNGTSGFSGDGGPATAAQLKFGTGVLADGAGNIYFADHGNYRIRKIDASGTVTTVAGNGTMTCAGDGGAATAAGMMTPWGLAMDGAGNLYISQSYFGVVRKIDVAGNISTVAGTGVWGYSGDGGPATLAQLRNSKGLALDAAGNLYISEVDFPRIRKVNPSGIISTFAGIGTVGFSGDGGPASAAQLYGPVGMVTDAAGNLYVCDVGNHCIRKIDAAGIITTVAGTGVAGFSGDGGPATAAQLARPVYITLDNCGNLYITEEDNHTVRKVDATGVITTIAGSGTAGWGGDGGPATAATLNVPRGIALDNTGNIYFSDMNNFRIRKISSSNAVPSFSAESSTIIDCGDSVVLDTRLAATDADVSQTIDWMLISGPFHGLVTPTSFSATSTGSVVMPGSMIYVPTLGYAGVDTIKVRGSDCFSSDTITLYINVDHVPVVAAISGVDTICSGTIATLSNATAGGSWSASSGKVTISAGGIVTGVLAGLDTVKYTVTNVCGTSVAKHEVFVKVCPSRVIEAGLQETGISVYPNPNEGIFRVSVPSASTEEVAITITDMVGKKLKTLHVATNTVVDVIMDVPAGVYFINARTDTQTYQAKVVIK